MWSALTGRSRRRSFPASPFLIPLVVWLSISVISPPCVAQSEAEERRSPYYQCSTQSNASSEVGIFPRTNGFLATCFSKFTYCHKGVAIRGSCPEGLVFNPMKYDCDFEENIGVCLNPVKSTGVQVVAAARPLLDDPNSNDCSRRPCGFYPDMENTSGRTYVFCSDGVTDLRTCPDGSKFDSQVLDCVTGNEDPSSAPSAPISGKREPGNPLNDQDGQAPSMYQNWPATPVATLVHGKKVIQKKLPSDPALSPPPNQGKWSSWLQCPEEAYILAMLEDGYSVACSNPENPKEFTLQPKVEWGHPLPRFKCGPSGVLIGYKMVKSSDGLTDQVEYYCSDSPTTAAGRGLDAPRGAFCGPRTAACSISVRTPSLNETGGVSNIRLSCCPVDNPLEDVTPQEEKELVVTCENLEGGDLWRKCDVETGIGVSVPPGDDQTVDRYFTFLGYDHNYLSEDLKKLVQKTQCASYGICHYPWNTSNRLFVGDRVPVKKRALVPPGSRLKLYQVYAQVKYMRVYTPLFVEVIEDLRSKVEYEELREIPLNELPPEALTLPHDGSKTQVAPVVFALPGDNLAQRKVRLCQFHGLLSAAKKFDQENENTWILSSSKVAVDEGTWQKWGNCSAGSFIYKSRLLRNTEVGTDKVVDKQGVVKVGLACRDISKAPRQPKASSPASAMQDEEELTKEAALSKGRLEFVNPGFAGKWKKGLDYQECKRGIAVGFQMQTQDRRISKDKVGTENIKFICSCGKREGEERYAVEPHNATNGLWLERQVCKPMQALAGFLPKFDEQNKNKDDAGLTAFQMKCIDIPSPGLTCTPAVEQVPIAHCEYPKDQAGAVECQLTVSVGAEHNVIEDRLIPPLQAMEGVGHTLPCVIPDLETTFAKLSTPQWREAIWHPLINITGLVTITKTVEIRQVIGKCGSYIVRSNSFVSVPKDAGSGPEEPFELPSFPLDPDSLPVCWKDLQAIKMIRTPEGEKYAQDAQVEGGDNPMDTLPFHNLPASNDLERTAGGAILTSPTATDFGVWDADWKLCPGNSYVKAVNVKHFVEGVDGFGVTTASFRCHDPVDGGKETAKLELTTPTLPSPVPVEQDGWADCEDSSSYAIGFRLNVQVPQGDDADDVATDNVGVTCSVSALDVAKEFSTDVGDRGTWTERQVCKPKQAVCGFIGQFQPYMPATSGDSAVVVDNTGLNNLKAKCCDVFDPVATCVPEEKKVNVGYCDNTEDSKERPCIVNLSVGVSNLDDEDPARSADNTRKRRFYESVGYTRACMGRYLARRFRSMFEQKCGNDTECGLVPWTKVPDQVWMPSAPFEDRVKIPGNLKGNVYQIVGVCDDYTVKTSRFFVEDKVLELPVSVDDGDPANVCWEDLHPIIATLPESAKDQIDFMESLKDVKRKGLELNPSPYEFAPGGVILETPVMETDYPAVSTYSNWAYCNDPSGEDLWYADSIYVERQGTPPPNQDLGGLVAVGLQCRNIRKNGRGDHVISGVTPGAPVLDEVGWDWKRCDCGGGIGIQASSVPPKHLADDLALESLKLMCSCSETVWKTQDEFPALLTGRQGNWTKEQTCRPRQAVCGLRTRSKPYQLSGGSNDSLLAYDNVGVTRVQVKCCDVPNPALTCVPKEVLKEVGTCDNTDNDNPKPCLVKMTVGVTYDQSSKEVENMAIFYESVGWGLNCVIEGLQENIGDNIARSVEDLSQLKYEWTKKQSIWHPGVSFKEEVPIDGRTTTKIFQVVGECGPYLVATNRIIREDSFLRKGEDLTGELDVYRISNYSPPPANQTNQGCWTSGGKFRARDYVKPLPEGKNEIKFHGYPSATKFELASLIHGEIVVDMPDHKLLPKESRSTAIDRRECAEDSYMIGFAAESVILGSNEVTPDNDNDRDDMGMTHIMLQCAQPDGGSEKKQDLTVTHPGLEFNPATLKTYFQECFMGVLVGFQAGGMLPTSNKSNPEDNIGIENIRMVCSHSKALESPHPLRTSWLENNTIACRPYQALCAVSGYFGLQPKGNWKEVDAGGITNLQMKCCDVPSPANDTFDTPREVLRVVSVCDNLAYREDRNCESNLDVGITYDLEEHGEESVMHMSVGYSIPCVTRPLRDTVTRNLKEGTFCGEKFKQKRRTKETAATPCTFNWKDSVESRIFQHGLTSYNSTIPVKGQTRVEIFQVMAQLNSLLVLTNHFVHVTKNKDGAVISEEKVTQDLELFPELESPLVCQVEGKAQAGSPREVPGDLTGPLNPENKLKVADSDSAIPPVTLWNETDSLSEASSDEDSQLILTSMELLFDMEADSAVDGIDEDAWREWQNCSANAYVSQIQPTLNEPNGRMVGFKFTCVDADGHKVDEKVTLTTGGDAASGPEKTHQELKKCDCESRENSQNLVAVGFIVKSKERGGGVLDIRPACPCGSAQPGRVVDNEHQTETLFCPDRSALCGFQLEERKSTGAVDRVRASCCKVQPPTTNCTLGEKLYQAVVCDNSKSSDQRECSFDVNMGMLYDRAHYNYLVDFYEDLSWSLDCMSPVLAKKFATNVPLSNKTFVSWETSAKQTPPGPEWGGLSQSRINVKAPPRTKLEVFQVIGWCDLFVTFTDQFLLTTSSAENGLIGNTMRKANYPADHLQLVGEVKRSDFTCWMDSVPMKSTNNHAIQHRPPGNILMDANQLLNHTGSIGIELYQIQGNKNRKAFLISVLDDVPDDGLSDLVVCQEGAYMRKFGVTKVGGSDNSASDSPLAAINFLCSTPHNGNWKEFSLEKSVTAAPKAYDDEARGAFVGLQSKWSDKGLLQSLPVDGTYPMPDLLENMQYCHPGQALCGLQGAWIDAGGISNLKAACCQVQSPVISCIPDEKVMLASVCDNRRDGRKRKCLIPIGIGVGYSLLEGHKMSSYFHSSIGYTPDCMTEELRRKFQVLECSDKEAGCNYNWGSAPAELWNKLRIAEIDTEVDPFQRVEYRQQMGVCKFDHGAIFVFTPVFQRVVIDAGTNDVKQSEYVFSDLTALPPATSEKCPLEFMNITEPPPTTTEASVAEGTLVVTEWLNKPNPPPAGFVKCSFHGMPEANQFEFASSTGDAIILNGPSDVDMQNNLKTKWREWENCSEYSFVHSLETYTGSVTDDLTDVVIDAFGMHYMTMQCSNAAGGATHELVVNALGTGIPPKQDKAFKPCQAGAVAVGFEIQHRKYQGPILDDNAYVNLKQLCSCGNHSMVDFSMLDAADLITGDWDEAQVCRPREALCGYIAESSDFESHQDLSRHDNVAIAGLKGKCCAVPSPAANCVPKEERVLNSVCNNTGSKFEQLCEITASVGLSYHYKGEVTPNFYESIGWTLTCVKEELASTFGTSIGQSSVFPDFSWATSAFPQSANETNPGTVIWQEAVTGTTKFEVSRRTTVEVYQIVGECGVYQVHTNRFILKDVVVNEEKPVTFPNLGNQNPEPCWADLTPLKGRNWLIVAKKDFLHRPEGKRTYLPLRSEDGSLRKGNMAQTPFPPFPAYKWSEGHTCPDNSFIRSLAVRKEVQRSPDGKSDVVGVISLAYQCTTPAYEVVEERVVVHENWEQEVPEWRKDFYGDPGAVYQNCMGAAVGIESQSAPRGQKLDDAYGILDVRFLCGMGIDMDYTNKPPEMSVLQPEVNRDIICKRRQALCYSQASFSRSPQPNKDSLGMTNLKMGCCDVQSPIRNCTVEEKSLLAVTCDNRKYNRPRKCKFTVSMGIQYDVVEKAHASYFYESVGYTPTCLTPELKLKFKQYHKAQPELFQEAVKIQRTIPLQAKSRVDIYQVVGVCNEVLVMTNRFQLVTTDDKNVIKKKDVRVDKKVPDLVDKQCELPEEPDPAPPPPPVPVDNKDPPKEVAAECAFKGNQMDFSPVYTLESDGSNFIEGPKSLNIEHNHETTWEGYVWKNCSSNAYITGFDFNRGDLQVPTGEHGAVKKDKFGIDSLAYQCEPFAADAEKGHIIEIFNEGSSMASASKYKEASKLPTKLQCAKGTAIGFSLGMKPFQKFGDDEALVKFRLHCSCGDDPRTGDKAKSPESSTFKDLQNTRSSTSLKNDSTTWTDPKYCRPRESLCGVTIRAQKASQALTFRQHDNIGISNVRMKCCPVESPLPKEKVEEKVQLMAVCDNANGTEYKACKVNVHVGLSYNSDPKSDKRVHFFESVGWTIDCVKPDLATKFGTNLQQTKYLNWSETMTNTMWNRASKKEFEILAPARVKTQLFQLTGVSPTYKVYTMKFLKKELDSAGKTVSQEIFHMDDVAQPSASECWEATKPIRGRDWLINTGSPHLQCPERMQFAQPTKPEIPDLYTDPVLNTDRGILIRTPNPQAAFVHYDDWKVCPPGTFIRGWTSVAAGKEIKSDKQKDDYSGVVFIKAICRAPNNLNKSETALVILQDKNLWQEDKWTKEGRYGILNCVGAGIGIQGKIQTSPKPNEDKFFFHDTKLICSCGEDAGFVRDGVDSKDDNLKKRDELAQVQKAEVCKNRQALCGLKASWGPKNSGDFKRHDGFGISNLHAFCCEVPSPLNDCETPTEELVFASACDNSRGNFPRRCTFNVAVGITYDYDAEESASYFYASNGFTPTCISAETRDKFTATTPTKCADNGCGFKWGDDSAQHIWQEMVAINLFEDVQPHERFRVYQVVGKCGAVRVLTNQFVKVVADKDGKEISRTPWTLASADMPALKMKKCEMHVVTYSSVA